MNVNHAIVSAFERSKEQGQKRWSSSRLFAVALMCVFFVTLMAALASGAIMYRHVSDAQAQVNTTHLQSGLMANIVHVNDAIDSVTTGQGPEGKALVLVQEINGGKYETRVYLYEGSVVQEYAVAGRDYAPMRATRLFESQTFDFAFDGELLTITTDQGSVSVALRSQQGGGA